MEYFREILLTLIVILYIIQVIISRKFLKRIENQEITIKDLEEDIFFVEKLIKQKDVKIREQNQEIKENNEKIQELEQKLEKQTELKQKYYEKNKILKKQLWM